MTTDTLQHAKQALETLDVEKILSAYHDSFLFEDPPSSENITDMPALRAYFEALFSLPNVAFTDVEVHQAEAFAAIEWTWLGNSRSTGKAYRVRGASMIELRGGKIARETLYYDPRAALA